MSVKLNHIAYIKLAWYITKYDTFRRVVRINVERRGVRDNPLQVELMAAGKWKNNLNFSKTNQSAIVKLCFRSEGQFVSF